MSKALAYTVTTKFCKEMYFKE